MIKNNIKKTSQHTYWLQFFCVLGQLGTIWLSKERQEYSPIQARRAPQGSPWKIGRVRRGSSQLLRWERSGARWRCEGCVTVWERRWAVWGRGGLWGGEWRDAAGYALGLWLGGVWGRAGRPGRACLRRWGWTGSVLIGQLRRSVGQANWIIQS